MQLEIHRDIYRHRHQQKENQEIAVLLSERKGHGVVLECWCFFFPILFPLPTKPLTAETS